MEEWHVWIIAALLLFLIEVFTTGFAVICLSIGAVAGAIAAWAGCDLKYQILWFAVFSLIAFVVVRPLLLKCMRKSVGKKSGTEALIGREAVVCEPIVPADNKGRVIVDGDNWKAVSSNGGNIDKGSKVIIIKVDSVVLTVTEKQKQ